MFNLSLYSRSLIACARWTIQTTQRRGQAAMSEIPQPNASIRCGGIRLHGRVTHAPATVTPCPIARTPDAVTSMPRLPSLRPARSQTSISPSANSKTEIDREPNLGMLATWVSKQGTIRNTLCIDRTSTSPFVSRLPLPYLPFPHTCRFHTFTYFLPTARAIALFIHTKGRSGYLTLASTVVS